MKGSIKAAKGAICTRCGGVSFSSIHDDFFDLSVPKCIKCSGAPSKLRVSKTIPGTDGTGRRVEYYKDTEGNTLTKIKDALKLLANLNTEIKEGTFRPEDHDHKSKERLKFSNFSRDYLEICNSRAKLPQEHEDYLSPGGLRNKKNLIKNELVPYFKEMLISDLDRYEIQKFYRSYVDKFRTRDLAAGELKTMLRYANSELELIHSVPVFPKISRARQKNASEIPSKEIQIEIINNIEDQIYRDMWIVAATLVKRPSEVRAYKVEDLDIKNRTLTTRAHFSRGENGCKYILGRKSIKGNEELGVLVNKLDSNLFNLLVKYVFGKSKEDFLFQGKCNKFVSRDSLTDAWNKSCKKLGYKYRPYDGTKHASLTDLIKSGASMENARALAGHKTAKMTETYAKIAAIDTTNLITSFDFVGGS